MARSGRSRDWLLVAVAAVVTAVVAWFLVGPGLSPSRAPNADAPSQTAADPIAAEEGKPAESAEPAATPGGAAIAVWKTEDGALHFGDDPPPKSQELGTVTARDAHVLSSARPTGEEPMRESAEVEELMRRIRQDTARRPIAGPMGDPTWSVRDIEGIVIGRESMDVATDWVTNQTMIRVAQRLCRYVSAQGDVFESDTVVVRGRHGRILARCKAVG